MYVYMYVYARVCLSLSLLCYFLIFLEAVLRTFTENVYTFMNKLPVKLVQVLMTGFMEWLNRSTVHSAKPGGIIMFADAPSHLTSLWAPGKPGTDTNHNILTILPTGKREMALAPYSVSVFVTW